MSHLDFVVWVVGWAFLLGLIKQESSWRSGITQIVGIIIWVVISIFIWKGDK